MLCMNTTTTNTGRNIRTSSNRIAAAVRRAQRWDNARLFTAPLSSPERRDAGRVSRSLWTRTEWLAAARSARIARRAGDEQYAAFCDRELAALAHVARPNMR